MVERPTRIVVLALLSWLATTAGVAALTSPWAWAISAGLGLGAWSWLEYRAEIWANREELLAEEQRQEAQAQRRIEREKGAL